MNRADLPVLRQISASLGRASAFVHGHEVARSAIRAGLATALAYLATLTLRIPDPTWAVISSLYVLQTSVGSTLDTALGRIVGTAFGIAVGMAAVMLLRSTDLWEVIVLLLAIGLMGAAGEVRQELRYGAVVASILIISPGTGDLLEEALRKAYAISAGSAVGALVGVLVFPVKAHSSALHHIAEALRRCGELATAGWSPPRGEAPDWNEHNDAVAGELTVARDRLDQSRWVRRTHSEHPTKALRSARRLWQHVSTLSVLVDVEDQDFSERNKELIDRSSSATRELLTALGNAVDGDRSWAKHEDLRKEVERLAGEWRELAASQLSSPHDGWGEKATVLANWCTRFLYLSDGLARAISDDHSGTGAA